MKKIKLISLALVMIIAVSPTLISNPIKISVSYNDNHDDHGYVYRSIIESVKFGTLGPPTNTGTINKTELRTTLNNAFGGYVHMHNSDLVYETTTKENMAKFLKIENSEYFGNNREFWDCDDYAYRFQGQITTYWPSIACGIIWYNHHACNIFIDNDHEVWIIDAKYNTIYQLETDTDVSVIML